VPTSCCLDSQSPGGASSTSLPPGGDATNHRQVSVDSWRLIADTQCQLEAILFPLHPSTSTNRKPYSLKTQVICTKFTNNSNVGLYGSVLFLGLKPSSHRRHGQDKSVGGVNWIGDKSRLSTTENFETVLSIVDMRWGLLKQSWLVANSVHTTDKTRRTAKKLNAKFTNHLKNVNVYYQCLLTFVIFIINVFINVCYYFWTFNTFSYVHLSSISGRNCSGLPGINLSLATPQRCRNKQHRMSHLYHSGNSAYTYQIHK